MTLMKSGHLANRFPAALFEPVGRDQGDGVLGQHAGQAGEHTLGGAHGLAQGRTGLGFAQALFDVIEVGDLAQDPRDEPGRLFGGLEELPTHMPGESGGTGFKS